jgi:deoxyribonuclease-4
MEYIGTHIGKQKTFLATLTDFFYQNEFYLPVQIFTGSTKAWKRPIVLDEDKIATLEFVNFNDIKLFIHSIYLINFGRPSEECIPAIDCLANDLELGPRIGAKGVVVHCGKSLKMGKVVATKNMYDNVIGMLDYIKENCPLLIETPAGQGSELLSNFEEFSDFYKKFTADEKKKIKICIDTCHVYAAGVCPLEYITRWIEIHPMSIALVHWNDSKESKGSKKDRHAPAGEGYIGIEILEKVAQVCAINDIPMVKEW